MSTPTPQEKIASEIGALQSRLGKLQDGVRLNRARDALEDPIRRHRLGQSSSAMNPGSRSKSGRRAIRRAGLAGSISGRPIVGSHGMTLLQLFLM